MKKYAIVLLALGTVLSSCKKEETTNTGNNNTPEGQLSIHFSNSVGTEPVELGLMKYTNDAGNQYRIDMLKYYVSNIRLVKSDNSEIALKNYDLINAADASTLTIDAGKIQNCTITEIKFNIGVDSAHNHTGAQDGDLDPVKGMIWSWNTGYVFFKHEGKFVDIGANEKGLTLHFGTDRAYTEVSLPISGLQITGNNKKVTINFDLNELYGAAEVIDFNTDFNRQSTSANDVPWIDRMKFNFPKSFTIAKVE